MSDEDRKERNSAVFGQVPQAQISKPAFSEIPYENAPLPSNGLVYAVGSPLYRKETVQIKVMTSEEEDILSSPALYKNGEVITKLIESCLIEKNINVKDFISGDRNAVLVALRVAGYGAEYPAKVECGSCQEEYEYTFNLNELEIKRLEIEPVEEGTNLFKFDLPHAKVPVLFKFLTGHDQDMIDKTNKAYKKGLGSPVEKNVTNTLKNSIVRFGNTENKSEIEMACRKMRAMDSAALRKYMAKHEPGIDFKQTSKCSHCGEEEEVSIPMGIGFLRPDLG